MSDSKEEEAPVSLQEVNNMANKLFGGTNDDNPPNEEKKNDSAEEKENDEKPSDDNADKAEGDETKSNEDADDKEEKDSNEKSDATHESEENKDTTEEGEKSNEKSETEGEKTDKSETTDTDKTEGDTDGTNEADSSALGNTLGELTGTLTGGNEEKNETETDNNENKDEAETDNNENKDEIENNDDTNEDENSSAPVHEPSEKKTSTPRRNSPRHETQPISNYSDEELQKAIDDLLKNNKPPEDDMVPALRRYIESEMTEAALNQKYEYGLQLEKATNILNQVTATDPVAIKSENKRREAEERHATAKEKYDSSVKEWEDRISQYRQEQEKRISELEQEHKRQMNEFEEQWSKPENMLEYNKPSPQLIRLRTTEQNLALQKNFERAKDVKLQADRLQKEEQAEAQKRAVVDMRLAYEALDMRQRREMECLLQHTQSTIELMERERDKCIIPMSQVVKRHKENSRPKTTRSNTRGLAETSRTSPRPIRTKITATTIKPAIGLGITGIDVKQYIKPKKQLSQTMSLTPPNSPKK